MNFGSGGNSAEESKSGGGGAGFGGLVDSGSDGRSSCRRIRIADGLSDDEERERSVEEEEEEEEEGAARAGDADDDGAEGGGVRFGIMEDSGGSCGRLQGLSLSIETV